MSLTPWQPTSKTPLADWPTRVQPLERGEFLPPISQTLRWGAIGLMGTTVAGLAIVATMPHSVVVKADFVIRPHSEPQLVQAEVSGIVTALNVQENQAVQAGQVLAQLESLDLNRDRQQYRTQLRAAEQQQQALNQEAADLKREYAAQQQVQAQKIAIAQLKWQQSQHQQAMQQQLAQSELQEAAARFQLAQEEAQRYAQLADQAVVSRFQLKEKQLEVKVSQSRLDQARLAAQPPFDSQKLLQAETGQIAVEESVALVQIRQAQLALSQKQIQVQAQLEDSRQNLQHLETQQARYQIQAPSAGTLFKLSLRGIGEVVQQGDELAQVVPTDNWIAQATVDADAIAQITSTNPCKAHSKGENHSKGEDSSKGDPCTQTEIRLRVDAYPYPEYGTLRGFLATVSPDTVTAADGSAQYVSTLELETQAFKKNGNSYPLRVGMTGTAEFLRPPETLLQFWLRKARLWVDA